MLSLCGLKGNTCCDCLTIALLQIIVSITEAYPAIILHKGVEPCRLGSLPALLPRVEHLSSIAGGVHADSSALQMLRVRYGLVLLATRTCHLLILTI